MVGVDYHKLTPFIVRITDMDETPSRRFVTFTHQVKESINSDEVLVAHEAFNGTYEVFYNASDTHPGISVFFFLFIKQLSLACLFF